MRDLILLRVFFLALLTLTTIFLRPFGWHWIGSAAFGAFLGLAIIWLETRMRRLSLTQLIGAVTGAVIGILGAFLVSAVLARALPPDTTVFPFLQVLALLWMTYLGIVIGGSKGDILNLSALGGLFGGEQASRRSFKILDTSVIIDGRIADIADTGFLDGAIIVPQFVLRELQLVADSSDPLKRNRGRRGLDILQRMQKMTNLDVRIADEDAAEVREVDLKLLELGKRYNCKIVTNDFNLNKVAQVHGVEVLNINELANALKPVVLPGEIMRVFILKEGKEYNQGVAYLDDGTMVVVDNARKMISKTVDISVTSVLQTTAGKMIFGRFEERMYLAPEPRPERMKDDAGANSAPHAESAMGSK